MKFFSRRKKEKPNLTQNDIHSNENVQPKAPLTRALHLPLNNYLNFDNISNKNNPLNSPTSSLSPQHKPSPSFDNLSTTTPASVKKKRLSSCSDTELSREDRASLKAAVRRRGSDTEFSKLSSANVPNNEIDPSVIMAIGDKESIKNNEEGGFEALMARLETDSLETNASSSKRQNLDTLEIYPIRNEVGSSSNSIGGGNSSLRKPSAESIHSVKRLGVVVSPTTSAIIKDDLIAWPEPSSQDLDRGWLTEDTLYENEGEDKFQYRIRVFRKDSTFATVSCPLRTKVSDLLLLLAKKFFINDIASYGLYLRKRNIERELSSDERPLVILKRMLEKIGYTSQDDLRNIGREDNSYYFKFLFDKSKLNSNEVNLEIPNYQHIDLRAKNLRKIPINLRRHSEYLQTLNLSMNLMINFNDEFFKGCINLKELKLSKCEISFIPECIQNLVNLKFLDLSCNKIKSIPFSRLKNLNQLNSLLLGNNRIEMIPSQFNQLKYLTNLNLSNNRFQIFPKVITELTNLIKLDLSFNEIRELPSTLSQLTHLKEFLLISNRISGSLPQCFNQLFNLKHLDLRKNLITNLDCLGELPNLEILLVDYNSISTLNLNFKGLIKLMISKNSITRLIQSSLPIESLISLNLSFSKLVGLPEDIFLFLPNLEELSLDNNRLVVLPNSIGTLTKLINLNVSNNELTSIPSEIKSLISLKYLDLHDNNLISLPIEIWDLKSLHQFNASSNLLKEFPRPHLQSIHKTNSTNSEELCHPPLSLSLKKLYLGDNRLTDDVFTPISLFTELIILNLSYNILDEIPQGSLLNLSNLVELYLSGNQLSTLPSEDLEKLRGLRSLYLNSNRLQTLPAELGKLGKLHTLDVGNNVLKYNICNFPYDWNWNWNTGLRYLNLSGNKRLQIKHNLSENSFSHLNLPDFSNLVHLRVLGLMDVTLMVEAPTETSDRRVRTQPSQSGRISYGIADKLRTIEVDDKANNQWDKIWTWDRSIRQLQGHENMSLFALFDGHTSRSGSGSRIAKFLNDHLEQYIMFELNRLPFKDRDNNDQDSTKVELEVEVALRRCFLALNKELGMLGADENGNLGASGVVAFIHGSKLYIANVGDTAAVLCRNAGTAHLLSTRHTPWATEEISRIRDNKGFISPQGLLNGELEISRGFGHFHLAPLVNANPSIEAVELTDNDEFIILATRSLWDKMSYQTAVDVARMESDHLMVAAQKVRDFAITYGADDSISVMIIGVSDLFAYRDHPELPNSNSNLLRGIHSSHHLPLQPHSTINPNASPNLNLNLNLNPSSGLNPHPNSNPGVAYKRNRWRNQGPGSSKLARLGSKIDEAPTGRLALVFTDIKNSTFLWESLPTAMRFAVKSHNLSMRRWLISLGGYEVKTEGDAFRAAFQSVTSAILWCLTMQVHLLSLDWPKEILDSAEGREIFSPSGNGNLEGSGEGQLLFRGLSVRMGIHVGTPICEKDPVTNRMDYKGYMVKRSDSICTFADGGQICISSDVVRELETLEALYPADEVDASSSLAPNSLPRDVRMLRKIGWQLVSLGEHKLHGLEHPEPLSLIYPKALIGRHQHYLNLKSNQKVVSTSIPSIIIPNTTLKSPPLLRNQFYNITLPKLNDSNVNSLEIEMDLKMDEELKQSLYLMNNQLLNYILRLETILNFNDEMVNLKLINSNNNSTKDLLGMGILGRNLIFNLEHLILRLEFIIKRLSLLNLKSKLNELVNSKNGMNLMELLNSLLSSDFDQSSSNDEMSDFLTPILASKSLNISESSNYFTPEKDTF